MQTDERAERGRPFLVSGKVVGYEAIFREEGVDIPSVSERGRGSRIVEGMAVMRAGYFNASLPEAFSRPAI